MAIGLVCPLDMLECLEFSSVPCDLLVFFFFVLAINSQPLKCSFDSFQLLFSFFHDADS